jgi:hypothetical protein
MKTFEEYMNTDEGKRLPTTRDADKFLADVLKLGSKENLFDSFMKKEGIGPDGLGVFVDMVGDRLKEYVK